MIGEFLCRCPPMEVFNTSDPAVRMTDTLYSDVTIEVGDLRVKGYLCWRATPVRSSNGFITSKVDTTSAVGYWFDNAGASNSISLIVSAEQDIGPLALPTPATGSVQLPSGLFVVKAELPRVMSLPHGGGVQLVREADVSGTVEG